MKHKYIKNLGVFFILAVLLPLFMPVTCADPAIMVTSYEISPSSIMPGDEFIASITITNTESIAQHTDTDYINSLPVDVQVETISATIENVWITSDGDGSYSITAHENYEDIGDLSPGSSITLNFLLTAHENISDGFYAPIVHVDVEDYQDVQFPIPIRVSNSSITIIKKDIPQKISSSGSTPVTVTIVNRRNNDILDAEISCIASETTIVTPQIQYLGTINSQETKDVTFYLQPDQKGTSNITFTVLFRNGYNTHSKTLKVPIEIIDSIDVSPILYNVPKTIPQGTSERVSLEVFNAKTEPITGVIVEPITNLSVSPAQYFIGEMNPDDVYSASFELNAENMGCGNYTVAFKVSFKQGNDYYETQVVSSSIKVVAAEQSSGNEGLIATVVLTASVIFVLVLFFVFKKRKNVK